MRLNWGCGPHLVDGWVGSDINDHGQEHVGDIREGLPWGDSTFRLVVAHHSLSLLTWEELVPALRELRRVMMPSGVFRASVPDLMGAVRAYHGQNPDHFKVSDTHEPTLDGKFCMYVTQAGASRSVFTLPWLGALLTRAGFTKAWPTRAGVTQSVWPEVVELDSRPAESLFVEALK